MTVCNSPYITRESAGELEINEESCLFRRSSEELTDVSHEITGTRMLSIVSEWM
jgi:hypothetical protein